MQGGTGGMGNPAMRGQNPYGGGYGGGGLQQQRMGMGGRFPTPNGQFGNPAYGMGGRFGGGMQGGMGGPTAMPKPFGGGFPGQGPFGGGAMQGAMRTASGGVDTFGQSQPTPTMGQWTGGGTDTFGQSQPNPAMRQSTGGGADTFGQGQPTPTMGQNPSLLGGGQGQPPPMQDFGNWLNDYRTAGTQDGVTSGFTGTQNGRNYINGNPYAAEYMSQGTNPNSPDFAFQNILNAYAPQISQLGGATSGAPSLGGATSPPPSLGGATPQMDPSWLKGLLGGMFS